MSTPIPPGTTSSNSPALASIKIAGPPFTRFTDSRLSELAENLGRADWGLFGPGSVTWRIHAHPVIVVGGFRALISQSLHPLAIAGISQYSNFKSDPLMRFRRTAQYIHHITFSDTKSAYDAAARVRRVHERINGIDPVTGREFSACDPETLLWVHCAEAHSFMTAYTKFAGSLTPKERDRYLAEQVIGAELIGIPRKMVPDSVAAYRKYFAQMLPTLCVSQVAAEVIDFVARPDLRLVPVSEWPFAINLKFAAHAAITLLPRSIRRIAGLPMPGPSQFALHNWAKVNGRALGRALQVPMVASTFDGLAKRKLGVEPIPTIARRET